MGHEIAQVVIDVETANKLRESIRGNNTYWGRPLTFESAMVTEAIGHWEPERRSSDARAGYGYLAPMVTENTVDQYIGADTSRVVDDSAVIPVARPEDVKKRTEKTKVTVTADDLAALANWDHPTSNIWRQLHDQYGHQLVDAKVVKTPAPRKPKATTTDGKIQTTYDVVADRAGIGEVILDTKDTIAEARAAALTIAADDPSLKRLAVRARVVRVADDSTENLDLVVIERPVPEDATATVEVTLEEPKPGAIVGRYVVAFDFHV